MKERIFISSVQTELAKERRAISDFVRSDPLLHRFFDVFLFEDLPASDRRADEVYLDEVGRCAIYVGLLGQEYGSEGRKGLSPTERELDQATALGKTRLVFVKGSDHKARHPKMRSLIRKVEAQLIHRPFADVSDLTRALQASLVEYLEGSGAIQSQPYEERSSLDATLDDIDVEAVADFVQRARSERRFPIPLGAPKIDVLAHLNLLCGSLPSNAATLLFGRNPQRFIPCAEVRCMHFHGTDIQRPAPFYQIFKGRLFEQVDRAADFVLGVINRSVGTRAVSSQAPVSYEIPADVIREAIVNAIAHRDYASAAAVQVSVFSDRVEVRNPGVLPPPLTPEGLRQPHSSIARNPRIAEVLFLARYIEKYGTGTLMMIRETTAHGLPEPDFNQRSGEFVTTIWRNWLTAEVVAGLSLNERQKKAIVAVSTLGRITNAGYQDLTGASRPTAIRDLAELVGKGVLVRQGAARSAHYTIAKRRLKAKPDDARGIHKGNESETTQMTRAGSGKAGTTARRRDIKGTSAGEKKRNGS